MNLPTLLCGPILRRCDKANIWIWLATSIKPKALTVNIRELKKENQKLTGTPVITTTEINEIQPGQHLFIFMLEVRKKDFFRENTIYSYDIMFKFNADQKTIYHEEHILNNTGGKSEFWLSEIFKDYAYNGFDTPVFTIPNNTLTKIFYGSCRKFHGPGKDALGLADKQLQKEWKKYLDNNIPVPQHSLFLLGDQIYADDVKEELFSLIQKLSRSLMGYDERIDAYYNNDEKLSFHELLLFLENYITGSPDHKIEELNFIIEIKYLPGTSENNRKKNVIIFLRNLISTQNKREKNYNNNLIDQYENNVTSLKEVIDKLSKRELLELRELLPPSYLLHNFKSCQSFKIKEIPHNKRREFLMRNAAFTSEGSGHLISFGEFAALHLIHWSDISLFIKANLINFSSKHDWFNNRNNSVRRLFANVPVYMMFDDHEVTDDWFIDETWKKRVISSVTGRNLISNALAAYWSFQGWGNNPYQFLSKFTGSLKNYFTYLISHAGLSHPKLSDEYQKNLLEYNDWSFVAPTNPIAVMLDTRTMRSATNNMDYNPSVNNNKKFKASKIMSDEAFRKLKVLLNDAHYEKGSPIVICSPIPVVGSKLFEQGQLKSIDGTFNRYFIIRLMASKRRAPGRYKNDFENWNSNPLGKHDLLEFIDAEADPSRLIILSGDVHYGFHWKGKVINYHTKRSYIIDQFTSSSIKNNTIENLKNIKKLALFSSVSLKARKYKKYSETYPYPSDPSIIKFQVEGELQHCRYSDHRLIFHNNIGLLEINQTSDELEVSNSFLVSF